MWRQRDRGVIPYASRTARRTFGTLAGKAGVPMKGGRLQNHALQDVSLKHYDRWNYMVECRHGQGDKFGPARSLAKKKGGSALKKAA